jgi:hypothetical protein
MDGLLIVQDLRLKLLHLATNLLPAVIPVWVSFTCFLMHLALNMYIYGVVSYKAHLVDTLVQNNLVAYKDKVHTFLWRKT